MELGGAETSLLGFMQALDPQKVDVDLLLFECRGALIDRVPQYVRVLPEDRKYQCLMIPIKQVLIRGNFLIAMARLIGRYKARNEQNRSYMTKLFSQKQAVRYLPCVEQEYDLAVSFIDPHFFMCEKVKSNIKMGWLHMDYSRICLKDAIDFSMWNACDWIVHVSKKCEENFLAKHGSLKNKSLVIENILSEPMIFERSHEPIKKGEVKMRGLRLLSIGRFSFLKNFTNIPQICKLIVDKGFDVSWYIIGYGEEEDAIRRNILLLNMENNVIILGKKENPYPYIKACDIYVQPSHSEGKSVAVREAQLLGKPVVITDFPTANNQLENGVDGVIVPLDNEGCSNGIVDLAKNKELMKQLSENCLKRNYSNTEEIGKIYELIGV